MPHYVLNSEWRNSKYKHYHQFIGISAAYFVKYKKAYRHKMEQILETTWTSFKKILSHFQFNLQNFKITKHWQVYIAP